MKVIRCATHAVLYASRIVPRRALHAARCVLCLRSQEQGADVAVWVSAYPGGLPLQMRALENQLPIITAVQGAFASHSSCGCTRPNHVGRVTRSAFYARPSVSTLAPSQPSNPARPCVLAAAPRLRLRNYAHHNVRVGSTVSAVWRGGGSTARLDCGRDAGCEARGRGRARAAADVEMVHALRCVHRATTPHCPFPFDRQPRGP
jgi:hypothetical protein